jgi:hypothetical protein
MIATRAIIDNVKEVGNRHPTGKTISTKKFTDGVTFIFYRTLFPLKWVLGITQSPSNYRRTPGPQVPLIIGRRWESQVSDRSELNNPDFMYSGFWSCSKEPSKAQLKVTMHSKHHIYFHNHLRTYTVHMYMIGYLNITHS